MSGQPGPSMSPHSWSGASLVGRDVVIDDLTGAARSAAVGDGSLVVLSGEAGIGKTSVARAVARRVRDELDVTWDRCIADRSAPPFWPWRSVITTAEPATSDVDDMGDSAIGAQRFELLADLRTQLIERAHRRPMLHVIEDLQWADVASVLLLVQVATAIADAPLMIVATIRTGEATGRKLDNAVEDVRRLARTHELAPLRIDEIAQLIRNAGVDPQPGLAAMLADRTGGNPLYVTELLRAVRLDESSDELRRALAGSVPTRVSELVANRLSRLPAPVSEAVIVASVLGTEGDARALAAATATNVESVLELIEQARAARLLDAAAAGRWQFVHDLVRDAVYTSVSASQRAHLHATVLHALTEQATAAPAVLARHALAAQPLVASQLAVELATSAGDAAFAQHAYEEAVDWFQQALLATPDVASSSIRAELLVASGEAHRHIGEIEEARREFLAAADITDDPALLARAALGFADPGADLGIAYRTDDPTTGTVLDRAIAAQPPGDTVTTVMLESRLAAELYFSDDPDRARRLARTAADRAQRLGDLRALSAAGAVIHDAFVVGQRPLADQLADSEQLLAWAAGSGSSAALLAAHRARVFDLLAAGDLTQLDAEVLAFRRVADPLKAPAYEWWIAVWSAMRTLLDGRHEAAESRALAAYQIGERPFPVLAMVNFSFLLFFMRREQGRLDEIEPMVREYAASHADIPAIRIGLAFLLAELGRTDEARGVLDSVADGGLDRLHDRNWPATWFQLARAASLTGHSELAASLLDESHRPSELCVTVSLATVCLGATDLAVAWLLHAVGDLDGADSRFTSAAEVNARIGARAWLAQTRVDHAQLLVDRGAPGDHEAASRLATLASEAAGELGLRPVAAIASDLRHRLASTTDPVEAPKATFRRDGGWWTLEFGGRTAQVAHARGLIDVATLLARPGQALSVLELVGDAGGSHQIDRGAPTFDEQARRDIREQLRSIEAEIDAAETDGNLERAALARDQRQLLAEFVARDLGLGGRPRLVGDPIEKARKTVSTRIRRSISLVAQSHPELGRHLERSIDTGAWCAYRPAEHMTWTT